MRNIVMLSTLMLMFIFASCNKDQRAVKTLDGKWQQTKMNGNPINADEIYTIEFKACKLKKEEYCVITVSEVYLGQTFTFTGDFKVIDKGETLELRFTSQGTTQISRFKIKELSKSTLIIEVTEGTSVYTEEYKKI